MARSRSSVWILWTTQLCAPLGSSSWPSQRCSIWISLLAQSQCTIQMRRWHLFVDPISLLQRNLVVGTISLTHSLGSLSLDHAQCAVCILLLTRPHCPSWIKVDGSHPSISILHWDLCGWLYPLSPLPRPCMIPSHAIFFFLICAPRIDLHRTKSNICVTSHRYCSLTPKRILLAVPD